MSAREFRELAERLTKALVEGDFAIYGEVMELPLRIEPRDGSPYTLETEAALKEDFELYCNNIRLHGINDIYREVTEVEEPDETHKIVSCLVNLLRRSGRAVDPFHSVMWMRLGADGWRFHRIQSSLGHINWTLGQAGIDKGSFT